MPNFFSAKLILMIKPSVTLKYKTSLKKIGKGQTYWLIWIQYQLQRKKFYNISTWQLSFFNPDSGAKIS